MSRTVHEIVNPELFSLHPKDSVDDALSYFLALGISGAPVLDDKGHALGLVSVRELALVAGGTVGDRLKQVPAVELTATIEHAAHVMSKARVDRVLALDETGRTVGVVSAVDLVRALAGLPPVHPDTFPHLDQQTGLVWTEETPLSEENRGLVPDGAGLLVLMVGAASMAEQAVWAEEANNVRARLDDILGLPQANPRLAALLEIDRRRLRFRAALVPDPRERKQVLARLQEDLSRWYQPSSDSVSPPAP